MPPAPQRLPDRSERGPRFAYLLSLASLAFVLAMGFWAHQAVLTESTRAEGHLIAARATDAQGAAPQEIYAKVLVRKSDLGRLQVGQSAKIKLSTYGAVDLGELQGTLERIGNQAESKEEGATSYPVYLKIDTSTLLSNDKENFITPGIAITAAISAGESRVLNSLLRPFLPPKGDAPKAPEAASAAD